MAYPSFHLKVDILSSVTQDRGDLSCLIVSIKVQNSSTGAVGPACFDNEVVCRKGQVR